MTSLGNKSIIKNILNNINQMLEIEKSVSNIIGNAGGYLGLFLGYALLNVPEILSNFYNWIKGRQNAVERQKRKRRQENKVQGNKIFQWENLV